MARKLESPAVLGAPYDLAKQTCCMCKETENLETEPRFGYITCLKHRKVSPVEICIYAEMAQNLMTKRYSDGT